MNSAQARNAYRQSESQSRIHPVKLIHLMYERTLVHLDMALVGIANKNPQLRGENLGKAIAIIAELNASVKEDDDSEVALFLRGLYNAILVELPKAAINNDEQIVRQTMSYLRRLKEIWEETAMAEMESREKGKQESFQTATGEALGGVERKVAVQSGGVSFSI
ncbi:MAG: flagellar export chaperone FliS [Desulfurivibrio sp.]|jgi:flagellar protein FliS|nr:MAG: flagellar export chaperone FliS [Desulfurivibrio sp.]